MAQLLQKKYSVSFDYLISAADQQLRTHYYTGLAQALKKFNVDGVVLSTIEKKQNEDSYLVLAKNRNGETLGGIRVEVKTSTNQLPLEKCSIPHKIKFNSKIKKLTNEQQTIAEVCGLWVNQQLKEVTGLGAIGPLLCLEGTELALGLGVDVITAMLPQHTLKYALELGYIVDTEIPAMAYPDDRYLSTIVWHYNPQPAAVKLAREITNTSQELLNG